MPVSLILLSIVYLAMRVGPCLAQRLREWRGAPQMVMLKLTATPIVVRKTLCTACVYSHVVRGYEKHEELIFCGYAFPQREILFPVRECTDFRAEREAAVALTAVPEN